MHIEWRKIPIQLFTVATPILNPRFQLVNMSSDANKRTHSIATMGADGIGPEVVNAGVQVLKRLAQLDGTFNLQFEDYDWSSETYKKIGQYIPDGGLEKLKKHDAILFGAVGAPGTLQDTELRKRMC